MVHARKWIGRAITHLILIGLGFVFFVPFAFLVSTAFKSERQIFVYPPIWIPNPIIWRNFTDVFDYAPFGRYLINTLYIVVAHLFGTVVTCSLTGYAFARLRAPGRDAIFMVLLSTMMVPWMVTLIPVYILFARLEWINTFRPLVIPPLLGNTFYIFLLRQYYMTIPYDLDEAALMDGCTSFSLLYRIMLVLVRPGIITVAIYTFINAWNEFLAALIIMSREERFTLPILLTSVRSGLYGAIDWGALQAGVTVSMVPCLIIFLLLQRYYIQGLMGGAVKG